MDEDDKRCKIVGSKYFTCNMSGRKMRGYHLLDSKIKRIDLSDATLRDVELRNSDLRWANLSGTDLTGADLSGSKLTDINLTNTQIDEATSATNDALRQWKQEEKEIEKRLGAETDRPEKHLAKAYGNYLGIKICYEIRQGYAMVWVNEQEMENAKTLIRGIEDAITADHRLDTDKIWNSAAEGYEQMKQNFTLTAQREFDAAKDIYAL